MYLLLYLSCCWMCVHACAQDEMDVWLCLILPPQSSSGSFGLLPCYYAESSAVSPQACD